ncbi:hypothetical protein [Catalinimonas niigatensis]|uniref:hypothetical protein n=1 Tax=Catalinimonas niigatensis TaxID=1397264 RepID=UPI0026665F33|nr:hypothetical protein [Catalinimonas niigatensis]WPP49519.1 hypothetical protein PZB72_22875 [Catalinimonas niigatensis]
MNRYHELLKMPESGERFYKEFQGILPQEKFFTELGFVKNCDDFQWAFNKFLIHDKGSLYKTNTLIRSYFYDHKEHVKRLMLFAVYIKEYLVNVEALLLQYEYYELMRKFLDAREKINNLINMLFSFSFEEPMLID